MTSTPSVYLQKPVSNGNAIEQALIRRWWRESMGGAGVLVWEYCLEGTFYADAIVFIGKEPSGSEASGQGVTQRFPLEGAPVVLCEAKAEALSPLLIGQAIVYRESLVMRGARIEGTHVFARQASEFTLKVAQMNQLIPIIGDL